MKIQARVNVSERQDGVPVFDERGRKIGTASIRYGVAVMDVEDDAVPAIWGKTALASVSIGFVVKNEPAKKKQVV